MHPYDTAGSPPRPHRPDPPAARPRIELTPEQRDVVEALLDGVEEGEPEQTLGGYAGTGKTTLIIEIVARAEPSCAVVAPTGRAASVLRKKGIPADTIHSLIYTPIPACSGACFRDEVPCRCKIVGFRRKEMLACGLVVCDEASMVSRKVYTDLMAYGVPAIYIGDHGQLPPVSDEKGAPPFNLMDAPDYTLEHIHRHAGDIPRFAEHLRRGEPAYKFRPRDGSVRIADKEEPLDRLPVMTADRIICARNRTRIGINAHYRRAAGRHGLVEPGELVMCLKNDPDRSLYNGTLGTVLTVAGATFDISSEEGDFEGVAFKPDQFGSAKKPEMRFGEESLPFDYGYCSTAHKAQGGEWPTVLVIEEFLGNRPWPHWRWAYTAASRAQRRLVWRASTRIFYPSYDHAREIGGVA